MAHCLIITNARMMEMFICIAFLLFKTLDSIAIPCSVKAKGLCLWPPQLVVTKCDVKFCISFSLSSNIKSIGNLSIFRRTACFKTRVSTSYSLAKSMSSMTFFPLISRMLFLMISNSIRDLILGYP